MVFTEAIEEGPSWGYENNCCKETQNPSTLMGQFKLFTAQDQKKIIKIAKKSTFLNMTFRYKIHETMDKDWIEDTKQLMLHMKNTSPVNTSYYNL